MKKIVLCIVIAILFSCKSKEKQPPISEEKMIRILSDMHIADEMEQFFSDEVRRDSVRHVYYDSLYKIHETDSLECVKMKQFLEKNLEYYKNLESKVHIYLKALKEA